MRLDEIPSGSRIFVDSTIFIYHFAGASTACRTLLERCEGGDLKGLTSTVVLAEVAHRLMIVEALTQGLAPVKNLTKKLGEQPDLCGDCTSIRSKSSGFLSWASTSSRSR